VKLTCGTETAMATGGQACGNVNNAVTGCTSGSCVGNGQGQATCVDRAADGATCALLEGPFCTPPTLCINGTCQQPACQ
jgi:hypothetical protein